MSIKNKNIFKASIVDRLILIRWSALILFMIRVADISMREKKTKHPLSTNWAPHAHIVPGSWQRE